MAKTHYQLNKEWRRRWPEIRYTGKKRYYQKTQNARNGGRPYTKTVERFILAHEVPDSLLSTFIGRSVGAIQKRRFLLKA